MDRFRVGDQGPLPKRAWGTTNPRHPWFTGIVVVIMIAGFIAAMYLVSRAIVSDSARPSPSPVRHHRNSD